MEDYIFVEGKRYISAKKAARETGYTSDYVGQMAREGRLDSKKVGRIRFVDEEKIKSYTVGSDRKKTAVAKFSDTVVDENTQRVEVPTTEATPEVVPEILNITPEVPVALLTTAVPETIPEVKKEEVPKEEIADIIVVNKQRQIKKPVKSLISKIDTGETMNKVAAFAIALLIIFGPYVSSKTGVVSNLGNSFALAYDAVKFDLEGIASEVYSKTKKEGTMRLITDSLAFSENKITNTVASALYTYSRIDEIVANVPNDIAESGLDWNIDPSAKALKATTINVIDDIARSVYTWFYVRNE